MALRPFPNVAYMPILSLRPAEMRALEELPNTTKDILLPIVHLRAWMTANALEKGLERLKQAYGDRPIVIAVSDPETINKIRPVHGELEALRNHEDGFRNWCQFIQEHDNYIPAIQLRNADELIPQVQRLHALGRGLVMVLDSRSFAATTLMAQVIRAHTDGGSDVCFVIDYGNGWSDPLERAVQVRAHCGLIWEECPNATVAISASSFPKDFRGLEQQDIYERLLFDAVKSQSGEHALIYSDRGSARYEKQTGGGGLPKPRIDYPLPKMWCFFRSEDDDGADGYEEQANLLMANSRIFDKKLRIWGTQMIERTSKGESNAITNPTRSTAVRINLHLHRQSFYGNEGEMYDTEDDWNDDL